GPSLQRRVASAHGDDPTNWVAASPSPGTFPNTGAAPVINTAPVSQAVPRHGQATFVVLATGASPLRYQWRHTGTNMPAGTNAVLALNDVQFAQAGAYSVVVYNPNGSVESGGAVLSVFQAANIVAQPQDVKVRPGSNAVFSVFATSIQPITYQWRFNGADIPGATSPTLLVTNAGLADAGIYTVRVEDGIVSITSAPAALVLLVNPLITRHPVSQSVVTGANVILSVSVTNTATFPMGYRWRRGSAPLAFYELNSTNSFFVVTNVQSTAGYNVVVTNAAQTMGFLSATANITVIADTDGDGLPDEWEAANGFNPSDSNDATMDQDGDTMVTRAEYIAGTDPRDPLSYLKVGPIAAASPVGLEFNAVSNRTYTIEFTDAIGSGVWTKLVDIPAGTNNHVESIVDRSPSGRRVYRLATPRVQGQ
ncbi:MAG TPA: hypothetical protein VJS65_03085, partial [Verrucomicrobiae bacterium]|nr:hypothetical protein [Verrucomicrobiae bacterium]